MTTREITIITQIACEGLDNREWGIRTGCDHCYIGQEFDVEVGGIDKCPENFIYVWTDNFETERIKVKLGYRGVQPDAEYQATDEKSTILLFTLSEQ